ncbi:helix-turn-helix transcriptional regulator [Salinibacterium sp.]|uniref:helix-turn-helix domain-containing protein n=1 Tax=Salinibacterium sp. TaxID=1915057 RepID=UPI00286CC0C9|nr:helix-turn-helix transcriptional regulator [Salinibacterium sp.]
MDSTSESFIASDEAFAEAFRRARIARGLTQDFVAALMTDHGFKWTQATVYKVEKGDRKVSVAEAVSLASMVNTPVETLADPDPKSPRRLRTELERSAKTYLDQVQIMRWDSAVATWEHQSFVLAIRAYDEATSGDHAEGEMVPTAEESFAPLINFGAPQDYENAWNRLVQDESAVKLFREFGVEIEERASRPGADEIGRD